jgi:type II secretory pathway pseudopilin PulG
MTQTSDSKRQLLEGWGSASPPSVRAVRKNRTVPHAGAFTLVELLVGMLITSILLSAIATLAFAMSAGARDADDTIRAQMQLRYATVRISELIRTCQLVCGAPGGNDLVLWKGDYNRNKLIDVNEIAYIEWDDPNVMVLEFDIKASPTVLAALGLPPTAPILTTLGQTETKTSLVHEYQGISRAVQEATLLHGCSHVTFLPNPDPPRTRRLTISFDLAENNGTHHYEIDTTLLASAQHLLSSDKSTLVSDDD